MQREVNNWISDRRQSIEVLDALEASHGRFLKMARDAFGRGYQLPYRLELTNWDGRAIATCLIDTIRSVEHGSDQMRMYHPTIFFMDETAHIG